MMGDNKGTSGLSDGQKQPSPIYKVIRKTPFHRATGTCGESAPGRPFVAASDEAGLLIPLIHSRWIYHHGEGLMLERGVRIAPAGGQGLVEYALILVLVAVVVIAAVVLLGDQLQIVFCNIVVALDADAASALCHSPRCSLAGVSSGEVVSGGIIVEALVSDPDGDSTINRVEFYVDSAPVRTEFHYKYCLGGTDDCSHPFDTTGLSNGLHVISATVYDDDGNTGECSIRINVSN